MPIIVGVAAATIAVTATFAYLTPITVSSTPAQQDAGSIPIIAGQEAQAYRINTQCEILFAITKGQYPNGEVMPRIQISYLLEKYPDEFKPWKDILEDPEKRKAFAQNVPDEFNQVLVPAMMKESSINPDLESTAMLITDPMGKPKIKQLYDENGCQAFFDERQGSTSP